MFVVVGCRAAVTLSGVTRLTGGVFCGEGAIACGFPGRPARVVFLWSETLQQPAVGTTGLRLLGDYSVKALAASVARLSTTLGNRPIQNIPAMQTQAANFTDPDRGIGDKSGGFLLQ